jgi:hypothetical protein
MPNCAATLLHHHIGDEITVLLGQQPCCGAVEQIAMLDGAYALSHGTRDRFGRVRMCEHVAFEGGSLLDCSRNLSE